jgi:uncharacterized membrane protein YciS (DUF1049 family)
MSQTSQSFERHAKMVPLYHYWGTSFLLIPTLYFAYVAVTDFSLASVLMLVFAIGVNITGLFGRLFALGVQDRVIRLEERLRLERLLPDELRGRIEDVTTDQLIGLRFASDGELVDLTRRVLDGEFADRKSIKRAVKQWRPDHQRI